MPIASNARNSRRRRPKTMQPATGVNLHDVPLLHVEVVGQKRGVTAVGCPILYHPGGMRHSVKLLDIPVMPSA